LFEGVALPVPAFLFVMKKWARFRQVAPRLTYRAGGFVVAVTVNLLLSALMCIGISNYAPSMILLALLGMDPRPPLARGTAVTKNHRDLE
jgi:hypothetical protein